MDDWTTLVLGGFIGAIIAIPFGIFINIITPWVKSYFEKSSLTLHERRIYLLLKRYMEIAGFKENLHILNILVLMLIVVLIASLSILVLSAVVLIVDLLLRHIAGGDYSVPLILGEFFMVFILEAEISYVAFLVAYTVRDVVFFDEFKDKTIARLYKLGYSTEDLDKEKTEKVVQLAKTEKKSRKAKTGG